MGQTTKLFHFHWHQQNIVFPQPLLTAAHFATSQVEVAMQWGAQLGSQCSIHGGGLIPCLASKLVGSLVSSGIGGKILDAAPPLKAVATMGGELTSCAQTGPGLVACLGGKLVSSGIGGTLVSSGIGGQILDAIPPLKMMKNMGDLYGGCHNHGGHGLLTCFAGGLVGPLVSRGIGTQILDSAPALKSVFNMGHELVNCDQSAQGLVTCLGNRIINYVPPLSHLNKMSEILADFLEGFARVATTIAGQVLKGGSSLIQEAANSQFPATGAPPMVHHSGQSLVIKTHTQEHKPKMSALQTQEERGEDADPVKGGFGFPKFHSESGNYQSKLVSQLLCPHWELGPRNQCSDLNVAVSAFLCPGICTWARVGSLLCRCALCCGTQKVAGAWLCSGGMATRRTRAPAWLSPPRTSTDTVARRQQQTGRQDPSSFHRVS